VLSSSMQDSTTVHYLSIVCKDKYLSGECKMRYESGAFEKRAKARVGQNHT